MSEEWRKFTEAGAFSSFPGFLDRRKRWAFCVFPAAKDPQRYLAVSVDDMSFRVGEMLYLTPDGKVVIRNHEEIETTEGGCLGLVTYLMDDAHKNKLEANGILASK